MLEIEETASSQKGSVYEWKVGTSSMREKKLESVQKHFDKSNISEKDIE